MSVRRLLGDNRFFWGLERHMELVARSIGMDPLEFREKNLLHPGSTTLTGGGLSLTEIGQGSATALAQIAAEKLGFPLAKVKCTIETDTDKDPYNWQTVASKKLILSGNAVILACEDLLAQAYAVAAQVLRANVRDLAHDGEKIFVEHRPEASVTFAELSIGYAYPNGNGIRRPAHRRRALHRAGPVVPRQGDRPGAARARLELRRSRRDRRRRSRDGRVLRPEDRLGVRCRTGDQSRDGARSVRRRNGARPRHRAVRGLHLRQAGSPAESVVHRQQGPDRQDVPEVVESYVVQTPQPIDNWICETPRGSRRSHQFEQYHPSEDVPAS